MKEKIKHNFGEKEEEYDTRTQDMIPVYESPKFKESRDKAIEMIDSNKYGLTDGDFWILMNKTKNGKMAYTGLIISHNGCLKINDNLDNKVIPSAFKIDKEGYNGSLVYEYCDEEVYEVGEFSSDNGKNPYPYAMAFKRCFDRVVLKKSKLAYAGIYSEVEADEFKKQQEDDSKAAIEKSKVILEIEKLMDKTGTERELIIETYKKVNPKVENLTDLSITQLMQVKTRLESK